MSFLTLDKNFVLDNFNFVQDKNFFVQADGQGIWIITQQSLVVQTNKETNEKKYYEICQNLKICLVSFLKPG